MKYGVHVALWMTHWTEDIDRHLRTVAELGFDGAEISLLGMSDQNTKHLRRLILDCGLGSDLYYGSFRSQRYCER